MKNRLSKSIDPVSTRRLLAAPLLVLLAAALAGCGGDSPGGPAAGPKAAAPAPAKATPAKAAASGDLSAEEVARAARGAVRCPPPAPAPRPAGAPVDDIVGVRPGMAWEEAALIVMCTHPLLVVGPDTANRWQIQTYGQTIRQGLSAGFAQPRVQKTGQQVMRELQADAIARGGNHARAGIAPGTSRWYAGTMGLPGEERVLYVQREERFADDALPPLQTVEEALLAKYGTPTRRSPLPQGLEMVWSHDAAGRPRPATAGHDHCGMNSAFGGSVGLREGCGVVVSVLVRSAPANAALAQSLTVGVVDQARGLALLRQTEQRLQRADAERRARELKEAGRNAKGPTL
jgi:hypothetical protein